MSPTKKDLLKRKKIYISVTIVGDEEIEKLNKKYLGRDLTTDVLSFEMGEEEKDGTYYLGDVIVNKKQAERQAEKYGNNIEQEVSDLVAHGVLHLLGVDHKEEEK